MANDPQYRDLSKSTPFFPPFNDTIVGVIDKCAMAAAAVVGLFGILYFSLAPAAMSAAIEVSKLQITGYNCKMVSSITRKVSIYSTDWGRFGAFSVKDSQANILDFSSKMFSAAEGLIPFLTGNTGTNMTNMPKFEFQLSNFANPELQYERTQFDTHDDCLATTRSQITCNMEGEQLEATDPNDPLLSCSTKIVCSVRNNRVSFTSQPKVYVNRTMILPAFGHCNNQVNASACSGMISNCVSLQSLSTKYEDLIRKIILTPEVICQPFFDNPPYICTKAVPPSVPSILSQSFAFATTALAVIKSMLAVLFKMSHKATVKPSDNLGLNTGPIVQNVAKNESSPEALSAGTAQQP